MPGVQFADPSLALTEGDAAEAEAERSRLRLEFRVESASGSSSGGGGGGDKEEEAAAVLGPTVTVTRERQYRDSFDDGLLYKGEAQINAEGALLSRARTTEKVDLRPGMRISSVHRCCRRRGLRF